MNSPLFPYMTSFNLPNGDIQLKYRYRLQPQNSDKAVFMASVYIPGEDHEVDVVVKFTDTYCIEAHALLAKDGLAPKLFYCGKPKEVAMYVVVMQFVKGVCNCDQCARKGCPTVPCQWVCFWRLAKPNVILYKYRETSSAKLVDFDWCGKLGDVRYPADINMVDEMGWHEGVKRGGKILPEHDRHLFKHLTRTDLD